MTLKQLENYMIGKNLQHDFDTCLKNVKYVMCIFTYAMYSSTVISQIFHPQRSRTHESSWMFQMDQEYHQQSHLSTNQ